MLTEPQEVLDADRVVLPGVGAFPTAMRRLTEAGLDEALVSFARSSRPLLGICLGMQLLAEVGEEFDTTSGLGLIPGRVERMPMADLQGRPTRVPFVGWAPVACVNSAAESVLQSAHYYFVHSFRFVPKIPNYELASYWFHGHDVVAAVGSGSTLGVQFHPERSGAAGLAFLRTFANLP